MLMAEELNDQASGLRRMVKPELVRVVAVTGGKGGVGKTNVSINLAVAWAELGKRVMVLDADLGLANIDVVLGLHPEYDLSHVLRGECDLEEVVIEGPNGIKVVPAASGIQQMAELSEAEHAGLIRAFSDLATSLDVLIVDTRRLRSDQAAQPRVRGEPFPDSRQHGSECPGGQGSLQQALPGYRSVP
jgi:flagellar biosynthesis protein FlhG